MTTSEIQNPRSHRTTNDESAFGARSRRHSSPVLRHWYLVLLFALLPAPSGFAQDPSLRFGGQIPPEVDLVYERGLEWLAQKQAEDGAWKDGQAGSGVDGICCMAFLASGEDPNFGRWSQPIRKAVRHIILSQDEKTGYMPNSMYHHGFALLALSEAYGAVDESLLWQGADSKG